MSEIWLVCEGKTDLPVLAAVLTTVLGTEIIPKPAGGITTVASVAAYLARGEEGDKERMPGVTVAYVIDRDYRRREVADASFTDGKRCFIWRRHAIESYLLEPAVIIEAFRSLKESVADNPGGGPPWIRGLPGDTAIVAEGLRRCALARAPQEAGRFALERLWEDLSDTAGRIQKQTPKVLAGGDRPSSAACKGALIEEGARLLTRASETAASPHLEPASIALRYDAELERVTAAEYVADLRFLEEQNGRELLTAFLEWLRLEHKSKLKRETLLEELRKAVIVAYQKNRRLYGTDDFFDLANGVLALAGRPPVS